MTRTSRTLRRTTALALAALGFVLAASTQAQIGAPYDLTWYTFESGGTLSTDGGVRFALHSSLGQFDAASNSGLPYTTDGGFLVRGEDPAAAVHDWEVIGR